MTADVTDGVSHLKKSKKRKHSAVDDDEAQLKAEKKERKRLKKLAKEAAAAATVGDAAEIETAVSSKKSKSKKSKKGTVDESGTPTAVGTGATSTPSPEAVNSYLADNRITIHDGKIDPFVSFSDLPIPEKLRPALSKFQKPTPIQACAWPVLFSGRDVVGIAETGSGKTLAFALPAVSKLMAEGKHSKGSTPPVSVLVLSPTRELAIQSHETLKELAEPFGFTSVCVYGGASKDGQRKALQGSSKANVRIIVATPGRMLDFLQDGTVSLSSVSYLVLDEADRMLDHGFENDIRSIIGKTMDGKDRQTLMFSATWPESVRRLAGTFQRSPVRITVGSEELSANSRVEQVVEVIEERQKERRLNALLQSLKHPTAKQATTTDSKILVFCLYKKEAARVENNLKYQGYNVAAIHGDLNQSAREKALADFKSGKAGLMVATDVAARGLDIPNVNFVINYTFPLTTEDYVHRIGRTGRGGKSGKSHTFFTGENHERALAGELARVLHDGGFECEGLKQFPMTVRKKEHSAYGAFFKDVSDVPSKGTKIKF